LDLTASRTLKDKLQGYQSGWKDKSILNKLGKSVCDKRRQQNLSRAAQKSKKYRLARSLTVGEIGIGSGVKRAVGEINTTDSG